MNSIIEQLITQYNDTYIAENKIYRVQTTPVYEGLMYLKTKLPQEIIFSNILEYVADEVMDIDYDLLHSRIDIIREEYEMTFYSPKRLLKYMVKYGYELCDNLFSF